MNTATVIDFGRSACPRYFAAVVTVRPTVGQKWRANATRVLFGQEGST
jgi:hypothetical protein